MAGIWTADIWFDPSCPYTWLTSRWLVEVTKVRPVEVRWHVMSLSVLNEGRDDDPEGDPEGYLWVPVRICAAVQQKYGHDAELGNLVEGWSQSMVCLIEQGKRDIIYDVRRLLAFTDTVGMPRSALLPLILGDPDAILEGDDTVALREAGTVDIDRRVFNTLAVGFAAAAVLPPPARVDRAHVRYLQAGLGQLRTQDGLVGGGTLLPEALRQFTQARAMLDESDYTETVGRELLIVAADLGLQSAWFAYDANDQPLARRLYQDAALLADNAGDSQQRVHMYANMAQQSTHLAQYTGRQGFAREALRFADRAEDAARHEPSPALHSLILMRRSLANAQLGVPIRHHGRSPGTGPWPARNRSDLDEVRPSLGDHRVRSAGQGSARFARPGRAALRRHPRRHRPILPGPGLPAGLHRRNPGAGR